MARGLPVRARERELFGWFADRAAADATACSALARASPGWRPAAPGVLADPVVRLCRLIAAAQRAYGTSIEMLAR